MAQQNQTQGRSIELKTLVIAALAAVAAAVVTSFFWKRGTLISTALTPVIVTLTQEILRRPAEKISSGTSRVAATPVRGVSALAAVGARRSADTGRFSERRLLEKERGEDEASNGAARNGELGAGHPVGEAATNGAHANGAAAGGLAAPPPPLDDTRAYDPARSAPGAGAGFGPGDTAPGAAAGETGEPKVYGRGPSRWRIALLTGIAAFAIAAAVLTVSELALGGSVGGDGRTSLFGGDPGSERADGGGSEGSTDDSSDEEQEASPSDSSESQSVPEDDSGGGTVAPEEEPAPEEEEPVEPEEPAPVEPAPAEPAQ